MGLYGVNICDHVMEATEIIGHVFMIQLDGCSIHDFCVNHTDMSNTIPYWTTPSGTFTLQHAYHLARPSRASLLSHNYILWKFQKPAIQLFLRKLYHGAFPIVDNLMRFAAILPTRTHFVRRTQHSYIICFSCALRCICFGL